MGHFRELAKAEPDGEPGNAGPAAVPVRVFRRVGTVSSWEEEVVLLAEKYLAYVIKNGSPNGL